MSRLRVFCLCFLILAAPLSGRANEPPKAQLLRVQKLGDTTYFHVRFDMPADLHAPALKSGPYSEAERRKLALTPALVPQDAKTSAVYHRLELPHFRPDVNLQEWEKLTPVKGLEFAGKLHGAGKACFLLLYPTAAKDAPPPSIQNKELAALLSPAKWVETPVELDFDNPTSLSATHKENLEKVWAQAQASRLAVLEALAPQSGFFGFACAATGRKYGVPDPALEGERMKTEEHLHRRMLDLTTGTAAITESLALKRLRGVRAPVPRTVDIAKVRGIEIAEHPWQKMMGDRKPAPEPLAQMVPHDNYYVHFRSFAKFAEFQDFIEQWATPASRAYEVQSRDHGLKERYERQLCLKSTWLGRTLGPLLVRSVAITGSDPYLREGSDVTVLFHVVNQPAFLAGVEQYLVEARKEFAGRLKEGKELYHYITVESFVTPLREVSVYRAAFGDFVVYSNSPAGLRRVIDTHQGRTKSLAASLDFQYMRTVFRADDKAEDGFAFLPDAFIRQLVGPASKIKEMRRLEALTSLSMLTNGALFTAWETGKLPASHDALLKAAHLQPEYLYVPEGKSLRWDAERQVAVSDAYGTLHFATPLVELPIAKITPFEEQTYNEFRAEYQRLWRQFFDPVGIRFAIGKEQVKLEVYVLPMVNNEQYNWLRNNTGNGMVNFDPARLSPRSLIQYTMTNRWLGDWVMIRLDDSQALARLGEWWMLTDLVSKEREARDREAVGLTLRLPITAGVGINWAIQNERRPLVIQNDVTAFAKQYLGPLEVKDMKHKNTTITRLEFGPQSKLIAEMRKELPKGEFTKITIFHAVIDDGWYGGFDEGALKDLIERAEARKKNPVKSATVPINASLHVAPSAANQAGAALRQYLEWETHKRALPNDALWYILYRAKLIDDKMPESARRAAAMQFLGYVPVSPDEVAYRYDAGKDEVVHPRHGSLRQPRLQAGIAEKSPLAAVLAQFPSLRVDLRFREDGFHSVVTLQRKKN